MPAVIVYPTDTAVLVDEAGAVAVESGTVVSVIDAPIDCAADVALPRVAV